MEGNEKERPTDCGEEGSWSRETDEYKPRNHFSIPQLLHWRNEQLLENKVALAIVAVCLSIFSAIAIPSFTVALLPCLIPIHLIPFLVLILPDAPLPRAVCLSRLCLVC